ncbi:glycosyltransferase family 9 protein [Vibrio parahaemolyticus]|uniref:glycosyltransferase family 9 protein n=1 Tax=Vibrio parahaemolyticus TaxID=670 RepID=UPI000946CCC3|nr:glycosyltransferase family 9 protein [Vibrio parahaemolyticus]EHH1048451.1 glycosyltransferase family 9 protein [Vibrio parahaemolyticus]EIA1494906.1 glycosyltransferase family 9 protein [Vibrio parahaemolyticus]ELA7321829.1 glycosyltransferase family 9 protein [Vibrio parahaemolyticus]MBE4127984.1 glycosyltransferase family 9 protein [Vibrio parahaemolyticus]PMT60408.1 lipopolysaccharide heptosyltransferase family protein [Vibrio parahaemolyticus]
MPLFSQPPSSICLLRLSAIGDVCHAVAVVQALQRHWPETQVTWIIGKVEAQLLKGLEGVELIVFDKKAGLAGMKTVWRQLKGRHFDALLHMQLAFRASLLTMGIKARYKVGFNFQRAKEGQWFFTNRKIQDTDTSHVLDSFYSFIEYLGVPRSKPQWQLPIDDTDRSFAEQRLGSTPCVVLCPAASKDERNWLSERYAALADYVIEQGYQVALCGSPTIREQQLAMSIQKQMQHQALNLVGQTSLKQLAAILAKAHLVVAPDSGPAHIATTQGTPVLGLYAHSNPRRTGPYNNINDVVSVYDTYVCQQKRKNLGELAWSTRAKGSDLMHAITLNGVIERFNRMTKGKKNNDK